MQKRLVLEEAKMSPYFLLGVISGTFGIVAYGTLESGSGYEIEVDIYLFLVGIEIYLRGGPWIVYIQCASEKVMIRLLASGY
jgi:sulfite exporter TauE/SafE